MRRSLCELLHRSAEILILRRFTLKFNNFSTLLAAAHTLTGDWLSVAQIRSNTEETKKEYSQDKDRRRTNLLVPKNRSLDSPFSGRP